MTGGWGSVSESSGTSPENGPTRPAKGRLIEKKSNKALGGRKWPDLRKAERRQKKMYRRGGTFLGKGGPGA